MGRAGQTALMSAPSSCWIVSKPYAGSQSQGMGLAQAAGLVAEPRLVETRMNWKFVPPWLGPWLLRRMPPHPLAPPWPRVAIGCGGVGTALVAAMRGVATAAVAVQHPGVDARRFLLVFVNPHDDLTGPNVVVTRTALHLVTEQRLEEARQDWAARFAHLPRPLVSVLIGGSNGRYQLTAAVAHKLAGQLAAMMRADRVGLVLTPSRRTAPDVRRIFAETLGPLGAWVWDETTENPYFGMLALSDLIIVTEDSVSMMSEAVATTAPVMLTRLTGRSGRIGRFTDEMLASGRVREFGGRYVPWPVVPMNDTLEAGAMLRRLLGYG